MTATVAGRLGGQLSQAVLLARVHEVLGRADAVMLYGSAARGSARTGSDVDILALVHDAPRSLTDADISITAYLPAHLRWLAARGSLFVLHLIHDGIILEDAAGELSQILATYRPPPDADQLSTELAVAAAGLISATSNERASYGSAMQKLAFYLLRTAVYDACSSRGQPEFDSTLALEKIGLRHLAPLLDERREKFSVSRLDRVLDALPLVLPRSREHHRIGLAATAVEESHNHPLASDLLTGVLTGDPVNYTALSLPPA